MGSGCSDKATLRKMIENGMDVARFDLGKLPYEFCSQTIDTIRELESEMDCTVGLFFDLRGPEIRLGTLDNGKVNLEKGEEFHITPESMIGSNQRFTLGYEDLLEDVKIGMRILFSKGTVSAKVIGKLDGDLILEVEKGGYIFSHDTVHIPALHYSSNYLSEKDKEDIRFAIHEDVDFLGLSFVRNSSDILDVTDLLIEEGNDHIQLISKIETKDAYEDLERIISLSDGIMVARGDLGLEFPLEELPGIQKQILKLTRSYNKLGIVSTDLLSSMINSQVPMRSEVFDCYQAVVDGADAVALGVEVSQGIHPVTVISTCQKILEKAEEENAYFFVPQSSKEKVDVATSISKHAIAVAKELNGKMIVISTKTGYTAKRISYLRPTCPSLALSPSSDTVRSLTLHYGIYSRLVHEQNSTDEIINNAIAEAKKWMKMKKNDRFVIVGGFPMEVGMTNFMRIEEVK